MDSKADLRRPHRAQVLKQAPSYHDHDATPHRGPAAAAQAACCAAPESIPPGRRYARTHQNSLRAGLTSCLRLATKLGLQLHPVEQSVRVTDWQWHSSEIKTLQCIKPPALKTRRLSVSSCMAQPPREGPVHGRQSGARSWARLSPSHALSRGYCTARSAPRQRKGAGPQHVSFALWQSS